MSKAHPPELKKFMDKKLSIKVNGGEFLDFYEFQIEVLIDHFEFEKFEFENMILGRKVEGMLRGFDPFMNLVIDDAIEYRKDSSSHTMGMCVIRGNSVLMIEALERI